METIAKRQRDTYISTLNHDLKIPTIAQIRALELLLDESMGSINHAQKEILNSTLDSCRYMYEMLSTITNTYKYENKDFELNKKNFELTEFIHECFSISNENFKQKNVNIILHSNNLLVNVYADKLQLKKAFKNLIDYCASNIYENSTLVCNIRKSHNHETVFISIVFQSPYLSAEKLKNMFNMYTTPTEKMDKVGSGLGLYLARQIIEAHSGKITISSNENDLCMYNIKLPCINECKLTSL